MKQVKADVTDYSIFDVGDTQSDISEAFRTQASVYAVYAVAAAKLEAAVSKAKDEVKQVEAEAYIQYREEMTENGTKFTEAMLSQIVLLDEEVIAAKDRYANLLETHLVYNAFVWALKQRADMLVSLGLLLRSEMAMTGLNIDSKTDQLKETLRNRKSV